MPTLNDQVIAYLASNAISFAPGDFKTGQPDGEADHILAWDTAKLGPQPTSDQLAAAPVYVPFPRSITPVQGRIALANAGLYDKVQAAVAAADKDTQIWFEYATVWERSNPILSALGIGLGLTPTQVDALFVQAAAIA